MSLDTLAPPTPVPGPSLQETLELAQRTLSPEHAANLAAIRALLPLVLGTQAILVHAPANAPIVPGYVLQNWQKQ